MRTTMVPATPKLKSRKVNGYIRAVLALEGVRRKREDRYDRFVRPLDRRRDALAAEVAARLRALSGGQHAAARRLLALIANATAECRDAGGRSAVPSRAGPRPAPERPRPVAVPPTVARSGPSSPVDS